MFFRRKTEDLPSWMDQMDFRWNRISSGYDREKGDHVYLTEPVLQFRRSYNGSWQDVGSHVEIMPAAIKAVNG